MAEISQPTPIKPVWPARREEPLVKRRPGEAGNEKRKEQQGSHKKGGRKPLLDDYA